MCATIVKQDVLIHGGEYYENEHYVTGFILCHRLAGSEVLIKIIGYRDQLYVQHEPMTPEMDDDKLPDVVAGGAYTSTYYTKEPGRFLARIKPAAFVMTSDAARQLAGKLTDMADRIDRGDLQPEE